VLLRGPLQPPRIKSSASAEDPFGWYREADFEEADPEAAASDPPAEVAEPAEPAEQVDSNENADRWALFTGADLMSYFRTLCAHKIYCGPNVRL
jgi:hypothetical protein